MGVDPGLVRQLVGDQPAWLPGFTRWACRVALRSPPWWPRSVRQLPLSVGVFLTSVHAWAYLRGYRGRQPLMVDLTRARAPVTSTWSPARLEPLGQLPPASPALPPGARSATDAVRESCCSSTAGRPSRPEKPSSSALD